MPPTKSRCPEKIRQMCGTFKSAQKCVISISNCNSSCSGSRCDDKKHFVITGTFRAPKCNPKPVKEKIVRTVSLFQSRLVTGGRAEQMGDERKCKCNWRGYSVAN